MPVSSSHTKVLSLTYVALMAALMAVCAWITIPVGPVPFYHADLRRFCGLGPLRGKRGTLAVVVYLLLGLVGLPVFAGFSSGAAALLGPTGGFLVGFLASALVYWGVTAKWGKSLPGMALAMGLAWWCATPLARSGSSWCTPAGSAATLLGALTLCVFPYILPRPGEDRPGPGPDPAGGEVRAGMTFL